MVVQVCSFLPRLHVLVVGPGLGRHGLVLGAVGRVLTEARNKDVPIGESHVSYEDGDISLTFRGWPFIARPPLPLPFLTPHLSFCPPSPSPLCCAVIDADGLWLVAKRPELVRGNRRVILTPNAMEFARLEAGLLGASVEEAMPSKIPPNHDKVRRSSNRSFSGWSCWSDMVMS